MSQGEATESAPEPVRSAALRLFASLGYDGTTSESIATAAGVSVEEVRNAGGRTGLYLAIVEDFFQSLNAVIDDVMKDFTSDAAGVHRLLDRLLDYIFDNPLEMTVWQYRGLADAADMAELDERLQRPFTRRILEVFGPPLINSSDLEILSSMHIWCIHGFINGGILQKYGPPIGRDNAEACLRFRSFLHRLTDAALDSRL
ncbi:TetR/AcrR family transcriptional regulator [Spirillospora sp. CA-255316]